MLCGNRAAHPEPLWVTDVATVRACYAGQGGTCGWLVDHGRDEDGEPVILPCKAHATYTDRGFTCEAGHEHVNAQTQWAEGWAYCEDEGDARAVFAGGREPRDMEGRVWL